MLPLVGLTIATFVAQLVLWACTASMVLTTIRDKDGSSDLDYLL